MQESHPFMCILHNRWKPSISHNIINCLKQLALKWWLGCNNQQHLLKTCHSLHRFKEERYQEDYCPICQIRLCKLLNSYIFYLLYWLYYTTPLCFVLIQVGVYIFCLLINNSENRRNFSMGYGESKTLIKQKFILAGRGCNSSLKIKFMCRLQKLFLK